MPRRVVIGLVLGLAAAILAWGVRSTTLGDRLESASYDLRLARSARPAAQNTPVALIEINESSVRGLEPILGAWPWPRIAHASVIDFLAHAGAKAVAYDVLFTEADTRAAFEVAGQMISGRDSDAAFVGSVYQAGNVILLADATFEGLARGVAESSSACAPLVWTGPRFELREGIRERPCLRVPFEDLRAAAAGIGHNLVVFDRGGLARRLEPFVQVDGVAVPALGVAAVLLAEHVPPSDVHLESGSPTLTLGVHRLPIARAAVPPRNAADAAGTSVHALLNFVEPVTNDGVTTTFPTYSFYDVAVAADQLSTGGRPAIDPAVFRNKVVFVGTTAAGLRDVVLTPLERAGTGGVFLHATMAENVLADRYMRRAAASTDLLVTIAAGLAAGLVATFLPVPWAIGVVLAGLWVFAFGTTRAVGAGLWIGAVPPVAAAALALFGGVAWQYFVEGRAKREVRQLFGRFVSRDVIDQLEADPAAVRLGGQRREMSVLFSDIRGFTAASEKSAPEEVVAQLNEYFTAMVEVLFRHHGTLDKFVGDMVMGLFGAPVPDGKHADHAVAAALDMVETLGRLNTRWTSEGRPPVDIGIGINSGTMIAGNIGSEAIMSYTVIGDAVNLAARLESLTKEHGTRILISEATRSALTTNVTTRRIGEVVVKGRTQPVVIHQVLETTKEQNV